MGKKDKYSDRDVTVAITDFEEQWCRTCEGDFMAGIWQHIRSKFPGIRHQQVARCQDSHDVFERCTKKSYERAARLLMNWAWRSTDLDDGVTTVTYKMAAAELRHLYPFFGEVEVEIVLGCLERLMEKTEAAWVQYEDRDLPRA